MELKPVKLKNGVEIRWPEDVARIIRILAERGYSASGMDAQGLWENYSEDYYAAGWIDMPDDDETVWAAIKDYILN